MLCNANVFTTSVVELCYQYHSIFDYSTYTMVLFNAAANLDIPIYKDNGTHQYTLIIIKRLTLSGKQQQEPVTTMSNVLCFAIMQITATAYFN